ncbi:MAG: hypothetical protein AB7P07_09040 [Hyphomonadaceae bacterium]
MEQRQTRLILGVSVAPLIGCVLITLAGGLWYLVPESDLARRPSFVSVMGPALYAGFAGGILVGWPTMLLAGLPTHGWLLQSHRSAAPIYAAAGAAVGLLPAMILGLLLLQGRGTMETWLVLTGVGLVTGAVSAVLFWLIRRPDRDAPNPPTSPP